MPDVDLPEAPVQPGYGRVVLESVAEPAEVHAVWGGPLNEPGHHVLPERQARFSGRVCVTPCTADLPLGRYDIYFTVRSPEVVKGDHDVLKVQPGLNVHRRVLGETKPGSASNSGGWVLTTLGLSAVGAGATFLGVGALTDFETISATPGIVLLLLGGVGAIAGALVLDGARGEQRDGATTAWLEPLPAPAPAPSAPAASSEPSSVPGADALDDDSADAEEGEMP